MRFPAQSQRFSRNGSRRFAHLKEPRDCTEQQTELCQSRNEKRRYPLFDEELSDVAEKQTRKAYFELEGWCH